MEWSVAPAIDEAPNAILFRFWRVMAISLQLGLPAWKHACRLRIESLSVQQAIGLDFAELALDNARTWVELLQDSLELAQIFGRHQVSLVQNQDVGKLNLIGQQVHDASCIIRLGA